MYDEQQSKDRTHTAPSSTSAVGSLSVERQRPKGAEHDKFDERTHANTKASTDRLHTRDVGKGKEKAPNADIVPKPKGLRRIWHRRHRSVGSSPLAKDVANAQPDQFGDAQEHKGSESIRSMSSIQAEDSMAWTESEKSTGGINSALGIDTDPAQIVNLALSLSESRRRNFSSGGYLLGREPGSIRRITPAGSHVSSIPYGKAGGSLRHHLQQQRQGNGYPRSDKSTHSKRPDSSASQAKETPGRRVSYLPDTFGQDANTVINASDATLARVEKARQAFELMYEYRRLLPHLPEILVSNPGQAEARRGSKRTSRSSPLAFGRTYNPLQYIRNRKVRLRERRPIDAEADGWKDVDRVRAWVDSVKQREEEGMSSLGRHSPLPPFKPDTSESAIVPHLHAPSAAQIKSKSVQNQRMRRPENYWTITPWELLADICWRYQDDNLKFMESPSGQKLFESKTQSVASLRLSKESARGLTNGSLSDAATSPETRVIKAAESGRGQAAGEDGQALEPRSDGVGRGRRARWTKNLIRSRDPSLSGESDSDQQRKAKPRHRTEREHMDNLALEKQMMDMLAIEARESKQSPLSTEHTTPQELSPQVSSLETSPQSDKAQPSSPPRPKPHRLRTDMPFARKQFSPPRTSLDDQVLKHRRLSWDELDTTNPNSPSTPDFIPSIAINFSPSAPRSVTATSPQKAFPSKLRSSRRTRSPDMSKQAVSDRDFVSQAKSLVSHTKSAPAAANKTAQSRSSLENENGHPPSEKTKIDGGRLDLHESPSKKSFKDTNEPDSRLRHFLKAGKIVGVVGNQVSRAGDALLGKDRNRSANINSAISGYRFDSENDDADVSAFDSSPYDLSRATTNNDAVGEMSRESTRSQGPRYFMSNLPSFKSPADKRYESPKSPKASPELDLIPSQQQAQKEWERSSRFDRLAPPKIDMRSVSPSPWPPSSRAQSRGFGGEDFQDSSGSRSGSRIFSHNRLNDILGIPGIPGQVGNVNKRPTPTGLSNLEGKRQWSFSDRGIAMTFETTKPRDIARVRALLLTSGVKANEIARRANEVPSQPSKLLQRVSTVLGKPLPPASQAQEHVTAARALLISIESSNHALQGASTHFSSVTVRDLNAQISGIGRRVNKSLTPLVTELADEADDSSNRLTTSHTLAVKQLNDQVDYILRRRRQGRRWLRRGGWALLEWLVLGTMWAVWSIVVIVKLIRGSFGLVTRILRWLFFL